MDPSIKKRMELYANLMEEAKVRLTIIDNVVNGRGDFHQVIRREICFLQLRMMCELVALSCLVAHGDISSLKSHKVGRAYSADDVIKSLEKLRHHFYPMRIKVNQIRPGFHEGQIVDPHPFPKEKMLELYGLTHRRVHRGSLRGLLKSDTPIDPKFDGPEIIQWAQRFEDMLSHHLIAISADRQWICALRNSDANMGVLVSLSDRREPPE